MAEDDGWVNDDDLQEAMKMEQVVFGKELSASKSKHIAQRLFEENAAQAAMSIIRTAIHGSNEKIKYDAAKYITERALGKISDKPADVGGPLEEMMGLLIEGKKGPSEFS